MNGDVPVSLLALNTNRKYLLNHLIKPYETNEKP